MCSDSEVDLGIFDSACLVSNACSFCSLLRSFFEESLFDYVLFNDITRTVRVNGMLFVTGVDPTDEVASDLRDTTLKRTSPGQRG